MILPLATAALAANLTWKERIARARAVLGDQRTDAIVAELHTHCRARSSGPPRPLLRDVAVSLEAAITKTRGPAPSPQRRQSSILEMAPDPDEHGGKYSALHAAALIRFYVSQCTTAEDRAAFAAAFGAQFDSKDFMDLAIVAAIRAGDSATKLDLQVFEKRAAKVAVKHPVYIRMSHHM